MKYKTPLSLRKLAAESQKWHCYYCGLPMSGKGSPYGEVIPSEKKRLWVTAEHLHARRDGGKDSRDNIVAAHVVCNQFRHKPKLAKSPAEFAARVKSRVAKKKWFNESELKLLISAESCIGQGGAKSRFLPAGDGHKIRRPVALRPLKNPS